MWDYLEHMSSLLSNIREVLRVIPPNLVRHGLSSKYSASDKHSGELRTVQVYELHFHVATLKLYYSECLPQTN